MPATENQNQGTPASTFRVQAPPIVTTPAPDSEPSPVPLALIIENTSNRPIRYPLLDSIHISLTEAESGRVLPPEGGRDGIQPAATLTNAIPMGESYEIRFRARLEYVKNTETFRLAWSDDFGGIWSIEGLRPGKYQLQIAYENHREYPREDVAVWTGSAVTAPRAIEVRMP